MIGHQSDTDFTEGMQAIYDALHPDVEDEKIPTHMYPFRGASFRRGFPGRLLTERQ
jgi:hypothetical protein